MSALKRKAVDPRGVINYGVLLRHVNQLTLVFGCRNCGGQHTHGWHRVSETGPSWRVTHCLADGAEDYLIQPIRLAPQRAYVVDRSDA